MKTALITGANEGIGLETARQLLQQGFYVYLGSRDFENGLAAVGKLNAQGLSSAEAVALNVTNNDSVKGARREIGKKTKILDVLINDAGNNGGSVEAGKRIAKYALIDEDGPTGKFFSEETNPTTGEISW